MTSEKSPYEPKEPEVAEKAQEAGQPPVVGVVPTTMAMSRLADFVMAAFRRNRDHRRESGIDAMLEYAAQSSSMEYPPDKRAILQQAGIDPSLYRPLTVTKIRACKAMLNDIIRTSGDKVFTLNPSPDPELPKRVQEEIKQKMNAEFMSLVTRMGGPVNPMLLPILEQVVAVRVSEMYDEVQSKELQWAKERSRRMETKVQDQFVEGDFMKAFNQVVNYICTYGTALMIGPVPRVIAKPRCKESKSLKGAIKYEMEYKLVPIYEAVNPWDCFPSKGAKSVEDGTLCIKVRYTSNVLNQYAEATGDKDNQTEGGWQSKTVRTLLGHFPNGGVKLEVDPHDIVRGQAENDSRLSSTDDCTLEGVRCFTSMRGTELLKFGISKTPLGEKIIHNRYYKVEAIVIAGYVVYCTVIDDRMQMPVAKAVLYEIPDSWWGGSLPGYLRTAQNMQNNAMKNIVVNGSLSSTGMFWCNDVQRAVSLDGTPALQIRAEKMIGFKASTMGNTGAPIGHLDIKSTVQEQLLLMKQAQQMADDDSGIPAYTYGAGGGGSGALRTASGLAMQTEAASRVINMCIITLGRELIIPMVKNTVVYNLIYDDDISIKGDCECFPTGLMGKILREQESQRRIQLATALATHPVLGPAFTVEQHFKMYRDELESVGLDPDEFMPSKERMETIQMIRDITQLAQAQNAQQEGAQGQPQGEMAPEPQPTPEQANVQRVEQNPQQVAMQQAGGGLPPPPQQGTVAERRSVA